MRDTIGTVLSQAHWTMRYYRQRMTREQWRQVLLKGGEQIIFEGHMVSLVAKPLGYGVLEVSKYMENAP